MKEMWKKVSPHSIFSARYLHVHINNPVSSWFLNREELDFAARNGISPQSFFLYSAKKKKKK